MNYDESKRLKKGAAHPTISRPVRLTTRALSQQSAKDVAQRVTEAGTAKEAAEQVTKQVATTAFGGEVNHYGPTLAVIENYFESKEVELQRSQFQMENVASAPQALDDVSHDRVEEVFQRFVQGIRYTPKQVVDLSCGETGDGAGSLARQNLVERQPGIQQVCDTAQKIAEKTGVVVSSDLQADRTGFQNEAEKIQVNWTQFQIEDGTSSIGQIRLPWRQYDVDRNIKRNNGFATAENDGGITGSHQ